VTEAERPAQGVQSVELGFGILEALAALGRPAPLREIAKAAGVPVGKTHRYLVSLTRIGLILQEGRGGNYDLGPGALRLGLAALRRLDHHGMAEEALSRLHERVGHTAGLLIWGSHGPTILRWKEADRAVTVNARPGHALPTTLSASGRVFAAFLPMRLVEPFLAEELAAGPAAKKGHDRESFAAILAQVRRDRLAVTRGEVVPGVDAVSAPVFDHDGTLKFVLSVWGSSAWIDLSPDGPVCPALRAAAADLSAQFGYRAADRAVRPPAGAIGAAAPRKS